MSDAATRATSALGDPSRGSIPSSRPFTLQPRVAARRADRRALPRQRHVEPDRVERHRRNRRTIRAAPGRRVARSGCPAARPRGARPRCTRRSVRTAPPMPAAYTSYGSVSSSPRICAAIVLRTPDTSATSPGFAIRAPAERREPPRRRHPPRNLEPALQLLVAEAVRHARAGAPSSTQPDAAVDAEAETLHPVDVSEVGDAAARQSMRPVARSSTCCCTSLSACRVTDCTSAAVSA